MVVKWFTSIEHDEVGVTLLTHPLTEDEAREVSNINDVHVQIDRTEILDFYGRSIEIRSVLEKFGYIDI